MIAIGAGNPVLTAGGRIFVSVPDRSTTCEMHGTERLPAAHG